MACSTTAGRAAGDVAMGGMAMGVPKNWGGQMRLELYDPVGVILREIADLRMKQRDVALTYAFCIRQGIEEFPSINKAITRRWKGKTALGRIKELAWNIVSRSGDE